MNNARWIAIGILSCLVASLVCVLAIKSERGISGIYTTTVKGNTVVLDFREKNNVVIIKRLYTVKSYRESAVIKPESTYISAERMTIRGVDGIDGRALSIRRKPTNPAIIVESSRPVNYDDSMNEQSNYTIKKGILTIQHPQFFSYYHPLEMSILPDMLVAADGLKFVKDVSDKTYSPAEIADIRAKTEAEAFMQKSKAEEAKQNVEKESITAETELKNRQLELDARVRMSEIESVMIRKQQEEKRLAAVQNALVNRENAINSLPNVANKVISFEPLIEGGAYSNMTLVRATFDGIIYKISGGGGVISLSKIPVPILESVGYNTNYIQIYINIERERSAQKILNQAEVPIPAEPAPRVGSYVPRSAESDFARRYGLGARSSGLNR